MEVIVDFPPLNGPFKSRDHGNTGYGIAGETIYAAFPWSQMQPAYAEVFRLAGKHGIGFFDASGKDGSVWLPGAPGELFLLHSEPA
jgi:hypothetical protein